MSTLPNTPPNLSPATLQALALLGSSDGKAVPATPSTPTSAAVLPPSSPDSFQSTSGNNTPDQTKAGSLTKHGLPGWAKNLGIVGAGLFGGLAGNSLGGTPLFGGSYQNLMVHLENNPKLGVLLQETSSNNGKGERTFSFQRPLATAETQPFYDYYGLHHCNLNVTGDSLNDATLSLKAIQGQTDLPSVNLGKRTLTLGGSQQTLNLTKNYQLEVPTVKHGNVLLRTQGELMNLITKDGKLEQLTGAAFNDKNLPQIVAGLDENHRITGDIDLAKTLFLQRYSSFQFRYNEAGELLFNLGKRNDDGVFKAALKVVSVEDFAKRYKNYKGLDAILEAIKVSEPIMQELRPKGILPNVPTPASMTVQAFSVFDNMGLHAAKESLETYIKGGEGLKTIQDKLSKGAAKNGWMATGLAVVLGLLSSLMAIRLFKGGDKKPLMPPPTTLPPATMPPSTPAAPTVA